jgi:exodeoxyribonuclease VII large subunit
MSTLLHRSAQRLDDLAFRLEAALTAQLRKCQSDVARLTAAVLHHNPRQGLAYARERLQDFRSRLDRSLERTLRRADLRIGALDARLHALSPLAVLDRGYALVLSAEGSLIRSIVQLNPGDELTTRLADGAFASRVESTAPNNPTSTYATRKKRRKN